MISFFQELFAYSRPIALMRTESKVRLGDLTFTKAPKDKIYGDKKPFTVDSDNLVCDGNHRMNKLLEENGPDHEVEVLKYKFPQWTALIAMGVHGFVAWGQYKWKSVIKELHEANEKEHKRWN